MDWLQKALLSAGLQVDLVSEPYSGDRAYESDWVRRYTDAVSLATEAKREAEERGQGEAFKALADRVAG